MDQGVLGLGIVVAQSPAWCRHATRVQIKWSGSRARVVFEDNGNLTRSIQIEAKGRNKIGAGNQSPLKDGVTHWSQLFPKGITLLTIHTTHAHRVQVDDLIQNGIDIDKVQGGGRCLETGAIGRAFVVQEVARGIGSGNTAGIGRTGRIVGPRVVAQCRGDATTHDEIRRSDQHVGPGGDAKIIVGGGAEAIEHKRLVSGKVIKVKVGDRRAGGLVPNPSYLSIKKQFRIVGKLLARG